MSRISITACDGCGVAADHGYNPMFPDSGWYRLVGSRRSGEERPDRDACSDRCLAKIVKEYVGVDAWADPLEALFEAPAARPKPRRKPTAK